MNIYRLSTADLLALAAILQARRTSTRNPYERAELKVEIDAILERIATQVTT